MTGVSPLARRSQRQGATAGLGLAGGGCDDIRAVVIYQNYLKGTLQLIFAHFYRLFLNACFDKMAQILSILTRLEILNTRSFYQARFEYHLVFMLA
jgi:hypothetical protein